MYKIKTPNPSYNGVTYGVEFINGNGQTNDEIIRDILVNDFGYEEVIEDKISKSNVKKKPAKSR